MTARTLAAASFALALSAGLASAQTPGDLPELASIDLVGQQPPPGPPAVQPPPGPPAVQPPPQGGPRRPEQPNQPRPLAQPPSPPRVGVVVPPREGQSFNIKVDVTISEQIGTSPPLRKTVSVVSGENMSGFVRSQALFSGMGGGTPTPLNVDVEPRVLADGKIRLGVSVQYDLPAPPNVVSDSAGRPVRPEGTVRSALGDLMRTEVRQNLKVVLENGKPLIISQAADPVGDRKVTIEVTATILK